MEKTKGELRPITSRTMYGKCEVCKKDFVLDENDCLRMARIQRGYFSLAGEDGIKEENVKAEFWICVTCYLENPLLCQFFNSIGLRIR